MIAIISIAQGLMLKDVVYEWSSDVFDKIYRSRGKIHCFRPQTIVVFFVDSNQEATYKLVDNLQMQTPTVQ